MLIKHEESAMSHSQSTLLHGSPSGYSQYSYALELPPEFHQGTRASGRRPGLASGAGPGLGRGRERERERGPGRAGVVDLESETRILLTDTEIARTHTLPVLPYRQSFPAPTQATDDPAAGADYHPAITAAAYANQRSSAADAGGGLPHTTHTHTHRPANPTNHPLQLASATLRDIQRSDLLHRKRYREIQDRERDRARARKLLSRAASARPQRRYAADIMEGSSAADFGLSEEEYAEMQKLSENYVPDVTGPEVSERISTEAIAAEYARADPSYQVKTASIPQTFPYYRRCKGDGHCGWRAIAFCYYETLLYTGSKQKYREEETRIRSMSNLIEAMGTSRDIFDMWEEEVLDLFAALANSPSAKEGEAILLANFNDGPTATWQQIITYMKTLTSSWIRSRCEDYEPFMQGLTAQEYCGAHVDPYQAEIEHVGLSALADVLLKPAMFALEVHYLDRSAGSEPFVHRFDPADSTGVNLPDTPSIRLLYRPGHYDILYAYSDAASQPPPAPVANRTHQPNSNSVVYLASPSDDSPHDLQSTPLSYTSFGDGIAMIPGISLSNGAALGGSWMPPPPAMSGQYPATPAYDYPTSGHSIKQDYNQPIPAQPAPPQPPHSVPLAPQLPRNAPGIDANFTHPVQVQSNTDYTMGMPAPPTYIENASSVYQQPAQHSIAAAPAVHHGSIDRTNAGFNNNNKSSSIFRPSRFEYESRWSEATLGGPNAHGRDLGFQTSIFRNSHFNVAHFNNPDFEPEQWQPGQEVCEKGRRKSMAP